MKRRDIIKQLESAGYSKCRDDGDHTVYAKENCRPISVPRHREVNENTSKGNPKSGGAEISPAARKTIQGGFFHG